MISKKIKILIFLTIIASMVAGSSTAIVEYKYHVVGKTIRHIVFFYDDFIFDKTKSSDDSEHNIISLQIRKFHPSGNLDNYTSEKDSINTYFVSELDIEKTALILIDVWKEHPNAGWLDRANDNINNKVVPLLDIMRKNEVHIIHAPHSQEIADPAKPVEGELVLDSSYSLDMTQLDNYLKRNGITTLLYAGYATNMCIFNRNVSMMHMRDLGYKTILVRDATIAFETPESLEGEWAHKMAVNIVEFSLDGTVTVDDLYNAFNK